MSCFHFLYLHIYTISLANLTFLSLVIAQTTPTPTATWTALVLLGGSTITHEVPEKNKFQKLHHCVKSLM